jgi:DNA polymerase III epsilon subunit-like protein
LITEDRTLVIVDVETTSLHRDLRRAWEVAAIVRAPFAGPDVEFCWQIDRADLDLANADPMSLEIGRFAERHGTGTTWPEADIAVVLHGITSDRAVLVGAIPSFDEETLHRMLVRHGHVPGWHHRICDVEQMARAVLGWPAAKGSLGDLAAALGIAVDPGQRHSALYDARLARDVYDLVRSRQWMAPLSGAVAA